jgi:pimeloyl-ACP methyl ester carboxylesterase
VLAGHSFGGLYTLSFAARYPDEVLGIVLLDSTAPQPATTPAKPAAPGSYDVMSHLSAVVATVGEVGLSRLYAHVEAGTLPPRSRDEVRASIAKAYTVKSTIDEYVQANTAMEQAAQLTDFERQAAGRPDLGRWKCAGLVRHAGRSGGPVDEQCAPHHRWCRT